MKRLCLLFAFLLTPATSNAQDSLLVSLPAWDIKYHVISSAHYIQWIENPYADADALKVYDGKYLQVVFVRYVTECWTYLPSRSGDYPRLAFSRAGCDMYRRLRADIEKHIHGATTPLEKL